MKKLLTALCLAATFSAPAQTLFTYGKEKVSADDFLRAFQKNNQGSVTEKTLKEYLDLYIASRLKIKEAKARGYDTLPQLIADLANLRQQILPNYLNDKESIDKMVNEAFTRSQKDIHLAHIFIKAGNDEAATEKKKEQVLQALKSGDFAAVAKEYSDDPSAKTNGGDLGWITVFSLPYELETLAYSTPEGKTSTVFRSKAGYHIFKNLGERKALGRIRAAQILLAIPPNADEAAKAKLKEKADSLYNRLQAGDDFGKLATAFSNDVISAASNGQITEFGVGEYDPVFENAVLNLPKDGAISKPFLTSHGYHIVKRIKLSPVSAKLDDETREALRRRVEQSDRVQFSKRILAQKVLKQAGYQKFAFQEPELWAYTDSVLTYQVPKIKINLKPTTSLLKVGDHKATVTDWTTFAQANRYRPDGTGAKPYPQLWNEFVQSTALDYYQDHLENFNEEFRRQINEFAEGNLFFEIMQRQVWTPAQTDSAALAAYYQQHKGDYNWKESADAVVFYAANENAAKDFYKALSKKPADWRSVLTNYSEQITADSNRFELAQLPKDEKQSLTAGVLTSPVVNNADNTASFAYVLQLHNNVEPRNFNEAKGLVINDYQTQLEKEWLQSLKKKYPVTVNEKVWSEVVKKASTKQQVASSH
jgi:peptidyl-prolyl cis-trans isomerase SurA